MLTTASSPILIFRIAVVASSAAVKVLDVVISHLQAASAPPFRIVDVAVRHLTHQFARNRCTSTLSASIVSRMAASSLSNRSRSSDCSRTNR